MCFWVHDVSELFHHLSKDLFKKKQYIVKGISLDISLIITDVFHNIT